MHLIRNLILVLTLGASFLVHAEAPTRWLYQTLISDIQKNPERDFSSYVGNLIKIEGAVIGPRKDKKVLHIEIYNPLEKKGIRVNTGVSCDIILKDSEISTVSNYPAAAIAVESTGTIKSVDGSKKLFTIISNKTTVTMAD